MMMMMIEMIRALADSDANKKVMVFLVRLVTCFFLIIILLLGIFK